MIDDARIETLLRARTRFSRLRHVASCPSTQDLAAAGPADGDLVVWAEHQTAGRGRQQRSWHDEPGADLAVTFRVTQPLPQPLALAAAVPLVVVRAVEPFAGRPLRIKWPNDVFLDGRKLAGVLIDTGVAGADTWLIGVGVNCNRVRFPPDLDGIATSLALATGHEVPRDELLLGIAGQLDAALRDLAAGHLAAWEQQFGDRIGLLGRRVLVEAAAGSVERGVLTSLDFRELVLDGQRVLPLAHVRGMRGQ